jgi:hypothetical protein
MIMVGVRMRSCVETAPSIRRNADAPKPGGSAISTAVRQALSLLLALCVCTTSVGCYRFAVRSKNATIADYHGKTVHSYLWNLVDLDPIVDAKNCGDKDLTTVRAKTNLPYISLEPISQMPEQDADAPEVYEAQEVLCMALVACYEPSVVLKPRKESLNPPATSHATKGTAILSLRALAVAAMLSDQLDSALLSQAVIQCVAVVRPVADQAIRDSLEKPVVDRLLHEGDLMG